MKLPAIIRRLHADRSGQTTLEYALVPGAFALPMYVVFRLAINTLAAYYQMTTFLVTLPFP